MLNKVRQTINKFGLLKTGDKIVIAVSGGADSVSLLHVLTRLADEYGLVLSVAHVNHGLRGRESERDEMFVQELCKRLSIPFDSEKIDIPSIRANGQSIEEVCREERYRSLEAILKRRGFTKIAIGHTADDLVETVLINFLRGSGTEGLKGFLPCRDGIFIRPLFEISKAEITAFLAGIHQDSIIDSSNNENIYLRNRIRHELLPLIARDFNPQIYANLLQLSDICRIEDDFIRGQVENILSQWNLGNRAREHRIPIPELKRLHPALQRRILKNLLEMHSPGGKGISFRHIESALALADSINPSARIDVGSSIRVMREYADLIIVHNGDGRSDYEQNLKYSYDVQVPGITHIKELDLDLCLEWVDSAGTGHDRIVYLAYEKLELPLVVRSHVPGDRIRLSGMTGRKKISDLFTDTKIPRFQRWKIPLVADSREIIWAAGIRLSRKARAMPDTKRCLRAEII